jgi:hypothetical protein
MTSSQVELANDSCVEFELLDKAKIDQERVLETIRKYEKAGLWPSHHKTRVVGFKKAKSAARFLSPHITDEDMLRGLVCPPAHYVEKTFSIISLLEDKEYKQSNFDKHEVTHIPQKLGGPDGYIRNLAIKIKIDGLRPSHLNPMALPFPLNCMLATIEDFAATNSYPGDKKDVIADPEFFIAAKKKADETLQKTLFSDTIVVADLCKFYPLGPETVYGIIERLDLPEHKREKITNYAHDLGESIKKSLGGIAHPTKEQYSDAMLDALDVFHVYESVVKHEAGETRLSVLIPAMIFRTREGEDYFIESLCKNRIIGLNMEGMELIEQALKSRIDSIPTPRYQNLGFH